MKKSNFVVLKKINKQRVNKMFFDKDEGFNWEEDEKSFNRCNEGNVVFVVDSVIEKVSKAGNEMLEVKMTMFDAYGNKNPVNDYLLKTENTRWKTVLFMKSINMYDQLKEGKISIEGLINKIGVCVNEYEKTTKSNVDGHEINVEYCRVAKYLPYDADLISSIKNKSQLYKQNDLVGTYDKSKDNNGFDDDIPF